ncbi:MAG: cob(I)yrinic acid a,c-diamide adenosyltransferase [Thermomicrobiales bacterium]
MRMYTGRGDCGSTDLLGERTAKDDPRVEALGALDEATSAIGLGRALATDARVTAALLAAQRDLYRIMAELAFTEDVRPAEYALAPERVTWLEGETDALAATVTLPREFVVPGESVPGAALDVARTSARRAERQVVTVANAGHAFSPAILAYMNRLSSLLFIAARVEDAASGAAVRQAKLTDS